MEDSIIHFYGCLPNSSTPPCRVSLWGLKDGLVKSGGPLPTHGESLSGWSPRNLGVMWAGTGARGDACVSRRQSLFTKNILEQVFRSV